MRLFQAIFRKSLPNQGSGRLRGVEKAKEQGWVCNNETSQHPVAELECWHEYQESNNFCSPRNLVWGHAPWRGLESTQIGLIFFLEQA